jgi:hypothetical protein
MTSATLSPIRGRSALGTSNRPSLLTRIFDAIVEARMRQVSHRIAAYRPYFHESAFVTGEYSRVGFHRAHTLPFGQ